MLNGYAEGYVTPVSKKTVEMPSEASTILFLTLCQAIDEAHYQVYRYGYELKKLGKKSEKWNVTILDIGE